MLLWSGFVNEELFVKRKQKRYFSGSAFPVRAIKRFKTLSRLYRLFFMGMEEDTRYQNNLTYNF